MTKSAAPGSKRHGRLGIIPLVGIVFAAGACLECRSQAPTTVGNQEGLEQSRLSAAFLSKNGPRYRQILSRARAWVDALEVDPVALQAAGYKGKKLYVELLDAYASFYEVATAEQRRALHPRLAALAAHAHRPAYHDMEQIDELTFKQGSTSYLRAAYLLERLEQDIGDYRDRIRRLKPRLDAHLGARGVNQKMAFSRYYQHFKLGAPPLLHAAFERGVIASRHDPYSFSKLQAYALTHEIFAPFDFGARRETDLFSTEDRSYLRRTLDRLTVRFLMEKDPDLVSELVSCQLMLGFTEGPVHREGLAYLLDSQNADGSWGNYERFRAKLGDLVKQRFYLHTTSVTISALTAAFGAYSEPGVP